MTQEPTVQPQTFDYYNFCVIQNYVFNEPVAVIENSCTYEENGVLYCASATEKGVYCYSYCLNNPLMYTDPSGQSYRDVFDDYGINGRGEISFLRPTKDNFDRLIALDENGKETNNSIKVSKGLSDFKGITVDGVQIEGFLAQLADAKQRKKYGGTSFAMTGSSEIGDIFMFAAQNSPNAEWGLEGYNNKGTREYILYTDHVMENKPAWKWSMFANKEYLFGIHSHPENGMNYRKASGYGDGTRYRGDMEIITEHYNKMNRTKVPEKYIYHPYSKSLIKYDPWNPQKSIKKDVSYPGGLLHLFK